MISRKPIFVAGIHGVGKTHLCKELSTLLDLRHMSAGELIRRSKQEALTTDKNVVNVRQNQDLLVTALNDYLQREPLDLLDGHFCLLKGNGQIEKISGTVFEQISPLAVVILRDDPDAVRKRLESRDSSQYASVLLQDLQHCEVQHATAVCRDYGFPLIIKNPNIAHERAEIIEHVKGWVSA